MWPRKKAKAKKPLAITACYVSKKKMEEVSAKITAQPAMAARSRRKYRLRRRRLRENAREKIGYLRIVAAQRENGAKRKIAGNENRRNRSEAAA